MMKGQALPSAGGGKGPRPRAPVVRTKDDPAFLTRRDGATRLGDQLRTERERRGLGLEQVADSTKIRKTYLEALERNDWNALPADVFTRGYLRTFAQHLGLDPDRMLRAYARERRITAVEAPATSRNEGRDAAKAVLERLAKTRGVGEPGRRSPKFLWIVGGLIGGGVAAVTLWAVVRLPGGEVPSTVVPPLPRPDAIATAVPSPANPQVPKAESRVPDPVPEEAPPAPSASEPAPARVDPELSAARLAAPPSVPEADPAPTVETASESRLRIPDSGVGTGVIDRRLVGAGDRFEEGTVVWFWTSVLGGQPGDAIQHVWLYGGRTIGVAELEVDSPNWRTQSGRQLPQGLIGDWAVEARDLEGRVLARADFTCVAAP